MSSATESSLLSKLESSTDIADIHTAFSKYLQPFTPKNASSKTLDTATLRSLARQFIPFLNKALSILPRRLSHKSSSSPPDKISTDGSSKLFEVYRLCLNCVGLVLPLLECKPYAAQAQHARLIHCLVYCGKYREAQMECLSVLEKMRGITGCNARAKSVKCKAQLVPRRNEDIMDQDFALLVVEIVITLVQCTLMIRSKDGADYKRVITLVDEASPWFKILNASAHEKFHRMLTGHLNKIGLYLVEELALFDLDLVLEFCKVTLSHYGESSLKDQMYKFALAVCCSILSKKSTEVLRTIDLLNFVLSFLAAKCEFNVEWTITEFLEVVNKCARSCRVETPAVCSVVGEQLSKLASSQANTLVGPILGIYASGLLIISSECQCIIGEAATERHTSDGSRSGFVLDSEGLLHQHLKSMREFFDIGDKWVSLSKNKASHLLPYFNTLKFFCQPLAKFVYVKRRQVLAEGNNASFISKLRVIQNAFDQLSSIFLHLTRTGAKCDAHLEHTSKENTRVILDVSIATLTLSLKTGDHVKESASLMKYVVSSDWVQADGLKHLFSSLYNVFVVLYRNKQLKEASKALKHSCKASWNLVVNHCKLNKLNKLPNDLSDISFKASAKDSMDFVSEASEKTAMLLDILFESSKHKMNRLLRDSFESWSIAESMLENISPPVALVKCWVKIGHKLWQNKDTRHNSLTLYNLLSSSETISKRALGVLLEQELLAHTLIEPIDSKFSLKMRMEVIQTLLDKIYVSNDSHVQKSRALIAKGGELRELGCENLDECIQCLSDAISLLEMCSRNCKCDIQAFHLRACAHCLLALCTNERTEQNSETLLLSSNFEDIRIALNLWLDPLQCPSTDQCSILDKVLTFYNENDYSGMFFENMLKMLHHLLDLLSIKGYTEMHEEIYEILIRLFKWKKLGLEEAFTFFWKSRSFGHGLCVSPMSEVFISKLSQYYGELSTSIRFWVKCVQPSRNLLVGLLQSYFSALPDSLQRTVSAEITYDEVNSTASGPTLHGSSIEDVKCAVSDLMSSVPLSDSAVFHAAYLYYDLSERSITKGEVLEALLHAKKAFQWRFELFKQKFRFTVKSKSESSSETGDGQRHHDVLGSFQLHSSVAKEVWFGSPSHNIEGHILTPWNVLQCYLESILQVSNVYEILGESSKAESLLHWGKEIALHQSLPLYVISFSSMLGKLFHKQMLWKLAEKELKAASQIMADNRIMISCLKCTMFLESTVHHQLGDLYRSHSCNNMGKPSTQMLSSAIENYRLAFQKLNIPARAGSACKVEDENAVKADHSARSSYFVCSMDDTLDKGVLPSATKRPAGKTQKKKSTHLKKEKKSSLPQEQCLVAGHNLRMTRSRYRSLEKSCDIASGNAECGPSVKSHNGNSLACNHVPSQMELASDSKTSVAECAHDLTLLCNKIRCWHCLLHEALKSWSLTEFGHLKWELLRRRNLWQLLIKIGKGFGAYDHNHKAHQIILLGVSLLVNPFCAKYSFVSWTSLIDKVNEDILRDLFAVEHAILLYNICRIALQSYSSKFARENHCQISNIGIPRIFSWLKLAFALCCEVPLISRKVSRLLTVVYVLSTSVKAFSQSTDEAFSENYWASFFHQASIGVHFNQQLFSSRTRIKGGDVIDLQDLVLSSSDSGHPGTLDSFRLTPKSLSNIDKFVKRFFEGLPCTTIICISVIGGAEAILLREVLCCASAQAWILLSRINSKNQPVILLLPIDSILDGSSLDDWGSNSGSFTGGKNLVKQWLCPWVPSIVDEIAPIFKSILKENYSSLAFQTEDGLLWWSRRKSLDYSLGKFLQDLEDSWLGPWKYFLLGEWSDDDITESLENKIMEDLKLKFEVNVHKDLLKVILSRARYASEIKECGLQLILNKGCYIGGCCQAVSNACIETKKLSAEVFSTVAEADSLETESLGCKPVILVLDSEVQMLSWESLPVLRDEEVYRMPSVSSISATLNRHQDHQEQLNNYVESFPVIDPLDSFYLLNPSGDLCETQAKFENWFKDQMFEGKSGTAPPCEELVTALKIHDLFIYLGHGSGSQYIPGHMLKNLDTCAATLLMGCSSGSLFANGRHAPTGTPLCYLLAGSPVIVANLWEVTDKDIDRFSKAMLDAWLRERSAVSMRCSECDELLDKFNSLEISNTRVVGKVEGSRNYSPDSFDAVTCFCKHRPTLGSFIGQARKACNFPFLIGASPVCYGVPTGIARKKRDVMVTP